MKSELLTSGTRAFAFLEEKGARLEIDDGADRSTLVYVLPKATVEVEYDWREQAVSVLMCRTLDGARPGGYYMLHGQRVRVHLLQALEGTGLADAAARASLRSATRRSGLAAMAEELARFSVVLAERFDAIVGRYDQVFPS